MEKARGWVGALGAKIHPPLLPKEHEWMVRAHKARECAGAP